MNLRKMWLALFLTLPIPCLASTPEPNAEIASSWWPDPRNVWTPIGWKDHFFRFNVIYNGTVVANPYPGNWKKDAMPWQGQGVQLTFIPSENGKLPKPRPEPYHLHNEADNGLGHQGWEKNATPLLWTEWPLSSGIVLRQEIFAHIPGGKDVATGIEPLFAWIRLSVKHVDKLNAPTNFHFLVQISAHHIVSKMDQEMNLKVWPERAAYPRPLKAESSESGAGLSVIEPDGRMRLAALPSSDSKYLFLEAPAPATNVYYLRVTLPARGEAHADLLLPLVPATRSELNTELVLGRTGALKESDQYWSVIPETAARFETPERQINEAISRSLKFAELITERNPVTGHYSFLSGSGHYDRLWPTPTSMASHMMLDLFGYHSVVEKHIELFRKEQGTVKPPGPAYDLHPGYFSSPKSLTSHDWLTDHGAILHQVAEHALLTGDKKFIDSWLEPLLKGCEFIQHARSLTNHTGVPGLLAPAVDTDLGIPNQSVWTIAWNYKGLHTASRLLQRIGHPRAAEFTADAKSFKADFVRAFREHTKGMPQWNDASGKSHPVIPASFSEGGNEFYQPFYLDCGPMVLVWAGLMDAEDELMRASVNFHREGPNTKVFNPGGNFVQRPVLVRELSSCEPCYSWNVYHSWELQDRPRYLEGMYSLLTGALSPQTYISCESRHGIYGNIFASPLMIDLARLSVIDDQFHENELHLLRICPLAWISKEKETRFENMATEFGPITLRWRLSGDGKTLLVKYQPKFRLQPSKIRLYVPPVNGLKTIEVNGKNFIPKNDGTIEL